MKNTFIFFTIYLLTAMGLLAQEKPQKSLHFLAGEWQVENYTQQGNDWKHIGNTQSRAALEHDGKFVSERTKFLTGFGEINMICFIGSDSKTDRFKLTAMDKEYGFMNVNLGNWVSGDLVFTNLQSDLPIKNQDGKELFFRVSYKDISPNQFTHWVEGTYDKGKTWFIFSKAVFKKTTDAQIVNTPTDNQSVYALSEADKKEIEALKKSVPLVLANEDWEPYEKLFSKNYQNWFMLGDQVRKRADYLGAVKSGTMQVTKLWVARWNPLPLSP